MPDMNAATGRPVLPTDSKLRKETPIATGWMKYFPRAHAYAARISVLGNEKHNPGEPLHWAEGKSMDHPDCIARHLIESETFDLDDGALHAGKLFWRAGANLEIILRAREAAGLPVWDEEVIAENRRKQAAKLAPKRVTAQAEDQTCSLARRAAGKRGNYEGRHPEDFNKGGAGSGEA